MTAKREKKKNIQRRDESNHFLSLRSVIFSIDNRPRGTASFRVFGQSRFRFPPAPSVKNCRLVRLCLSRRVTPTDDASARWNLASYSRPHFPFLARCHFSSSHPINTWSSTSISAILSQSFHSSFFFFEERKEAKNGEKIFALTREHWGVFDDPNLGMLLRVISRSTCLRLMKDRSDTKLRNNQSSKRLFQFDETNERGWTMTPTSSKTCR